MRPLLTLGHGLNNLSTELLDNEDSRPCRLDFYSCSFKQESPEGPIGRSPQLP